MTAEQNIDCIESERVELARYRISSGGRRLVGRRLPSGVEVSDHPLAGPGRAYRVDAGFNEFSQLRAFVEDYLDQARRLDACPMSGQAVSSVLAASDAELIESLLGPEAL
jgi:hypothetical protein